MCGFSRHFDASYGDVKAKIDAGVIGKPIIFHGQTGDKRDPSGFFVQCAKFSGGIFLKHIRLSSGKTYGEVELPESAPLIFPALDSLASDNGQGHNKLKRSQKFIADYFDRRAQATYAAQIPGSSLAVPIDSQFASRYSDPNHPANSGSLIALVTGGKGDPRRWRRERRARRRGQDPSTLPVAPREGPIKRMLKQVRHRNDCVAPGLLIFILGYLVPHDCESPNGR
ncbi:hypothetical protein V1506DRAFT_541680 [Lipomyces tetrasporus]